MLSSLEIQSAVGWPVAFGPVVWQYIMVGVHGKGNCSPNGGWNMRERKRRDGDQISPSVARLQ